MKTIPTFSIIVPVYNVEKYLNRCLDSILNNQIENFEVILVDDGSTDKSPTICDKYSSEHDFISVFHKQNGGLSDARNFGIKKAKGKYIIFIDSDDYIESDTISHFSRIIHDQEVDLIIAKSFYVDSKGNKQVESPISINDGCYKLNEFLKILDQRKNGLILCAQYFVCKREIVLKNNLEFEKGIIHEDELWSPKLILSSKTIYFSNFCFYYHVERNGSIMSNYMNAKSGESLILVVDKLDKLFYKSVLSLKYFKNHLAVIYLQAFTKLGLQSKKRISKKILLRNSKYINTIVKSLLFCISPRLYFKFWNKKYKAYLNK